MAEYCQESYKRGVPSQVAKRVARALFRLLDLIGELALVFWHAFCSMFGLEYLACLKPLEQYGTFCTTEALCYVLIHDVRYIGDP